MKVLVFGCGPAGLMAAHAAATLDHDVVIISKKRKSELFGCQYLHEPIPGVPTSDPVNVSYRLTGSEQDYRAKIYGSNSTVKVSPEDLMGDHQAWDIRAAYDWLWYTYSDYVIDGDVAEMWEAGLVSKTVDGADYVFSTVPAPALCRSEIHAFYAVEAWAIGDAPERGQQVPFSAGENTVVCNGEPSPSWSRMARVFGHTTVEWPGGRKPPVEGVVPFVKPVRTDCDCNARIHRLGRYGKWQKGILSHEAFNDVTKILTEGQGVLF